MARIKTKEIPEVKAAILKEQNYRCLLCKIDLRRVMTRNICLDHCHKTGHVRGVLCRNCNGVLGKVENLATRAKKELTHVHWLDNAVAFLKHTSQAPAYEYIHPSFKTEGEKRILRNKRAKTRRKLNGKTST